MQRMSARFRLTNNPTPSIPMIASLIRLVMISGMIAGAGVSASAQAFSLTVNTGGHYLIASNGPKQADVWYNTQLGAGFRLGVEYRIQRSWMEISLLSVRQRWETGMGSFIWSGRNAANVHQQGWWGGRMQALIGYAIPIGRLCTISPALGIGYDWQQTSSYCGIGSAISKDLLVPVTHVRAQTMAPSSFNVGTGLFLEYKVGGQNQPVWFRIGIGAWGRVLPLLQGKYFLWNDGGKLPQQPPWGPTTLRPGQQLRMTNCPDIPFTVPPDQIHDIHLPGHSLGWSLGARIPI